MATTYAATLQLEYSDGNTRNITFDEIPMSVLPNLKANVLNLNATIADSVQGAAYKDTFISNDGAPITRISGAKYTATETAVIYRG